APTLPSITAVAAVIATTDRASSSHASPCRSTRAYQAPGACTPKRSAAFQPSSCTRLPNSSRKRPASSTICRQRRWVMLADGLLQSSRANASAHSTGRATIEVDNGGSLLERLKVDLTGRLSEGGLRHLRLCDSLAYLIEITT